VLRKAIFNREISSRITAVTGFLQLLKKLKTSKGASQVASSNDLGNEILGIAYIITITCWLTFVLKDFYDVVWRNRAKFVKSCTLDSSRYFAVIYLCTTWYSNCWCHNYSVIILKMKKSLWGLSNLKNAFKSLTRTNPLPCNYKSPWTSCSTASRSVLSIITSKKVCPIGFAIIYLIQVVGLQPSETAVTAKQLMEDIISRMLSGNPDAEEFELVRVKHV